MFGISFTLSLYMMQDPDMPLFLLRNVCFFCDNNGIQAIGNLFDVADAEFLPINLAHTLVNLIANVSHATFVVIVQINSTCFNF